MKKYFLNRMKFWYGKLNLPGVNIVESRDMECKQKLYKGRKKQKFKMYICISLCISKIYFLIRNFIINIIIFIKC